MTKNSFIKTFIRQKYEDLDPDLTDALFNEARKTIILYGRSNAGKTYTMKELLFFSNLSDSTLKILEIYNDDIETLFESKELLSPQTIYDIVHKIRRREKKTSLNTNSSRSHLIIRLDNIAFIDLIGSERAIDREGIHGNKSLLDIGILIMKMKDGSFKHFRGGKISMIIKECSYQSELIFIGCVDSNDKVETERTIKFLENMQGIQIPRNNDIEIRIKKLNDILKLLLSLQK